MTEKNGKSLVIVESPAKAKTINKYLGSDYIVKASMGHVRDLPRSGMGVDLETFKPTYEVIKGRTKVVTELKKLAKDAKEVFLATDLDREGEAIAWHLREALKIPPEKAHRVVFNAITKTAIQAAFATPQVINEDKVNAQQARRILDRIVGYEISPLLWRKVARGLSAGRVQSVAVRLIVDRELAIESFEPSEYWKIAAIFTPENSRVEALSNEWAEFTDEKQQSPPTKIQLGKWLQEHGAFEAELVQLDGAKLSLKSTDQSVDLAQMLGFKVTDQVKTEDPDAKGVAQHQVKLIGVTTSDIPFSIRSIEKKRTTSRPSPPFITSTLQQIASSRFGFAASRTMRIAQGLYENGLITYMRTDSTHLSTEAIAMARDYAEGTFGAKYVPEKPNFYSSSKSAQEAHEAIRPTDVKATSTQVANKLNADELKLYALIWDRFVACQMSPAQFDSTTIQIVADTPKGVAVFRASGRQLVFDGFMRVTGVTSEDQILPELKEEQPLYPVRIDPTQHFTQPPPRYTEASLVKMLESEGIGRPSTYANIIQTIQDRGYVEQDRRRFWATLLGRIVTDRLVEGFPDVLDVKFTAAMEGKLDAIEEQHLDWVNLLNDFYGPFHNSVEQAMEVLKHAGGTESPYDCKECDKKMLYRISKTGFFLACSGYPECEATQPVDGQGRPVIREETEHKCPECKSTMIRRKGRFGEFLGCSGYPECKLILNLDKEGNIQPPKPKPLQTEEECGKCGKPMNLRNGKRGPWMGCSGFPKCRGRASFAALPEEQKNDLLEKLTAHEAQQPKLDIPTNTNAAAVKPKKEQPTATDIDCIECSKPMLIRSGKRGPFLGCSGFPKCRYTTDLPPDLQKEMDKASTVSADQTTESSE